MKVQIYPVEKHRLCWITVNQNEALALIQSLANQLATKNSNTGRLESFCTGDVGEMSIVVECE